MTSWIEFYTNLALGLGTFFGVVALGLVVEARWIGLPRPRRIGRWTIRI